MANVDRRTCDHPSVGVTAHTERTQLRDGAVGAYRLTIAAHCALCGTAFWFPGLPTGVSFAEPVTNPDGFQVTLPLVPDGQRCQPDPSLVSAMIRTSDIHKGRKAP